MPDDTKIITQRLPGYWFPVNTTEQYIELVNAAIKLRRHVTIVRPYNENMHCTAYIYPEKIPCR